MGLPLKARSRCAAGLGALAWAATCLTACRAEQKAPDPTRESAALGPSAAPASPAAAASAGGASAAAPPAPGRSPAGSGAPSAAPPAAPALDPARAFLVGTQGESVSLRWLDGQTRVVVPGLSSWLYDPSHGLLWFLDEDRLGVADLREPAPPAILATGIPGVGSLWVEWPESNAAQFVRPETGCEETSDAVELKLRAKPTLRMVESDQRRSLSRDGQRWLQQQLKRAESATPKGQSFDPGAPRVALPKQWSGCDDAERCGLSAALGPWRLVLVRDNLGADCFHLGCLLYDPIADRFASPPVLVDEGGMPSLAAQPPRWTSAQEATPGSCGPYRFDERGSAFLAHRFLCRLEGAPSSLRCEELPGDGIGWLRPGAVAGSPG